MLFVRTPNATPSSLGGLKNFPKFVLILFGCFKRPLQFQSSQNFMQKESEHENKQNRLDKLRRRSGSIFKIYSRPKWKCKPNDGKTVKCENNDHAKGISRKEENVTCLTAKLTAYRIQYLSVRINNF